MNNAIMEGKGEVVVLVEEGAKEVALSAEGEDVSYSYSFSRDAVMRDGCEARLPTAPGMHLNGELG